MAEIKTNDVVKFLPENDDNADYGIVIQIRERDTNISGRYVIQWFHNNGRPYSIHDHIERQLELVTDTNIIQQVKTWYVIKRFSA